MYSNNLSEYFSMESLVDLMSDYAVERYSSCYGAFNADKYKQSVPLVTRSVPPLQVFRCLLALFPPQKIKGCVVEAPHQVADAIRSPRACPRLDPSASPGSGPSSRTCGRYCRQELVGCAY